MTDLERCPFCGSSDVEPDCFTRTPEGVCTEPAVNCNGCGLTVYFDFADKEPWDEIARRWNARTPLKPDDDVDRLREAVLHAHAVFIRYAKLHRAKGTEDGDMKACANASEAEEMWRALHPIPDGERI